MTYAPAQRNWPAPVFLGAFSWLGAGWTLGAIAAGSPSSGTHAASRAIFAPFYLPVGYDLQRFWWLNGATVGTDTIQAAVYSVDSSNNVDCVVATLPTLSAGTVNQLQFATCAVVAHGVMSGTSTTDGTSFTTASVTLEARPGLMYALVFANSKASAAQAASAVSTTGGGVTFTSRNSQTYGASTEGRVNMWTAVPTSDVTDTILIDFGGGNTQTGCAWALVAFTNVDTTTNHGVVQTAVGSGNSTTPLATLSAFGSANNATFGLNANLADTTTTPGTGFTELYDINYATPTNCLQVQYSANDTTSDGTITSGQWGALAAEIKSLGTTYQLVPGRYYMALWTSGTTATLFRVSSAQNVPPQGVYSQDSLTTGLPLTATFANTNNSVLFIHGITNRATP